MKKKILILFLFLSMPFMVNASNTDFVEEEYNLVSTNEKYYKTTNVIRKSNANILNSELNENDIILSYTTEISKEEYDNVNDNEEIQPYGSSNYVQTEYKKLTVSILEGGTSYKYTAVLNWRKMPAVRSHDIITIGFYQSVKASSIKYQTDYCLSNGSCSVNSEYTGKITSTGAGAVFQLPTSSDVKSIKNTLTVLVSKNVSDATIIEQLAVADYAHATKKISLTDANKYSINISGLNHIGTSSYFDTTPSVSTSLKCNW